MDKFIAMDDAAERLGVPKERLNELREAGQLRAYRDGASWKFRTDEITKLVETGLPSLAADSGIASLDDSDGGDLSLDLDDADISGLTPEGGSATTSNELELGDLSIADDVGDSIELESDPSMSDADLAAVEEPTVAADEPADSFDGDADDLVLDAEASGDDAESILLSDAELGESPDRPPSTIIGKNELAVDEDDDLQLAPSSSVAADMSDVRLASEQGQADEGSAVDDDGVFSSESPGSEVIPGAGAPPAGKFEDLEELEIDLEAESSRILEAEDVAAAQAAQQAAAEPAKKDDSDLSLAPSDSGSGLSGLSSLSADEETEQSDVSLTGISSLDVDGSSGGSNLSGLSAIELAEDEDDDFVLGDSGSDLTLSGGDSGINLVPSDSGIALDDSSPVLGGSALGSGIDLGEVGSDISGPQEMASGELASSEDFLLTPIGDAEAEEEEDSSQIIALEAVEEDEESEESLLGGAGAMDLSGDDSAASFSSGAAPAMVSDASFSVWNVIGLGACLSVMTMCGVMMVDVIRNIWSSEDPASTTSSAVIDGLLGIFGG